MLVQKSSIDQEKPFACDVKGCEMTFTNKDHLDWHQKKHAMMLNLGLVNKNTINEVADQTPTPTRFIRNCEEVGLFQDLQNVNPFDELFKRAIDSVKNGTALEVQEHNSNESLHTPHILPHITDNQRKISEAAPKNESDCESFMFHTVNEDTSSSSPNIVVDNAHEDLKEKIRKTIRNNIKKEKSVEEENKFVTVVPLKSLSSKDMIQKEKKAANNKLEKIREMNKAAQNRCRKRKRQLWKEKEEELIRLREENAVLKQELKLLKLQHSKCPNQGGMLASIITTECSQATTTPTLTTTTAATTTTNGPQSAILVQFVHNGQLSFVPSDSISQPILSPVILTNTSVIKKDSKNPLRKIVPKKMS
ncbi:cyclic AMP-dependent transcription factor ATF-7 [Diabrotica virgifera virgifera]|uniref:Cyclic AMP-dependent transcription factor ATF-7 n=1 Tax=Diabrotica virgifera virgifera TaxID=50390 RepID=A0A6P7GCX4_DIAVI|nr:cyclic AMP-dependent transcription factor ATF-7 [Diabrotica virgifera virgifera]